MRIILAADAVADPESWRHLDQILYGVERGWHEWQIDDPEDLEETTWLSGSRPSLRELFEEAAVRSAYRSSGVLHRCDWVVSTRTASDAITPKAAASFFNRPLVVLVENRFTDGLFLETLLAFLAPKELRGFFERCDGEPFRCDSGGGCGELPILIDAHVTEMETQALPPRAVVFADSDARYPGQLSREAKVIAERCAGHRIDCLILAKRAIENYIPDQALRCWAEESANREKRPRVDAVCRLTPEQRDHIALKKRYPAKFKSIDEERLFETVPEADVETMRKADTFGDTLVEVFRSDCLSGKSLRHRDGAGELDRLVTMIAKAL